MQRNRLLAKLLYPITYILPAALLAWFSYTAVMFLTGKWDKIPAIISLIILVAGFPILRHFRVELRQEAELGTENDPTFGYKYKSKEERAQFDLLTFQQNEAALSEKEFRGMTKDGAKKPEEELNKLVGMPDVHRKVAALMADAKFASKKELMTYNMCFLGNPGTGKTTVAAIMAGVLHKYRILKTNQYVVVDGATLVASADPQRRINLLIQRAKGKLIFIDEAYAIAANPSVGNLVLTVLLNEMENDRKNTIVIFAGYKKEMQNLFLLNSGLESRIRDYIFFEDYTDEEMLEITESMLAAKGFEITDDALYSVMDIIYKTKENGTFSNARTARNIADTAISSFRVRSSKKDEKLIDAKDIIYNEAKDKYFADVNFGG